MELLKFWYVLENDTSHNFSNNLKLFVNSSNQVSVLLHCNPSWLMSEQKGILLMVSQLLCMVLQWLLNDSIAIL